MGDKQASRERRPSVYPGLARTVLLSVAVTLFIAWPVVRSSETMLFGREIAGRHYDPFTVMQQFAAGGAAPPYRQPLTDDAGVWLAKAVGPIRAFNVLVLLSFPFTTLATYLLAYYLLRSPTGAMVAALAFTFAPVRLAHAAYHVHIVQTQWIAIYLLALFVAVDRPTWSRGALLVAAVAGLALSNAYGGLIGAMITPVALPAYWLAGGRTRTWPGLLLPATALALAAAGMLAVIASTVPALLTASQRFAFPASDIGRYSAPWWAYWLPPIDHPLLGGIASRALGDMRFGPGIVEQQLSLGWSLTALATFGTAATIRGNRPADRTGRAMLAVAVIAVWSFLASLDPGAPGCTSGSLAPSCLVYRVAPMFRAYARLGIVTSLSVALLAGYAVTILGRAQGPVWLGPAVTRWLLAGTLLVAAVEYWPLPGRARDVLPTLGHRWLAERSEAARILDCTPSTLADRTLPWLMHKNIALVEGPFEGCDEPEFAPKLAALGFTHVITRASQPAPWKVDAPPPGLRLAETFPDARVYTVSAQPSPLVVLGIRGFWSWEQVAGDRWRWMGQEGSWTLFNTTPADVRMTLNAELESFGAPRHVLLDLDARPLMGVDVAVSRHEYALGPITVPPGQHVMRIRALEPAARPLEILGLQDRRAITISLRPWRWSSAP